MTSMMSVEMRQVAHAIAFAKKKTTRVEWGFRSDRGLGGK